MTLMRTKDHDSLRCPLRKMANDYFDRCLFWPAVLRIKAQEACPMNLCPLKVGEVASDE